MERATEIVAAVAFVAGAVVDTNVVDAAPAAVAAIVCCCQAVVRC